MLRAGGFVVIAWLTAGAGHARAFITASHVGCPEMSVSSLDRSVAFFTTVLEFKLVATVPLIKEGHLLPGAPPGSGARTARLILGEECLDLTDYTTRKGGPFPVDSRANDRWFQHIAIVVSDMEKAYKRVREARVAFVSNEPQTLPQWNKEAAGISAFYFRDPDGHYLELIHFPQGKGQAKWQTSSSAVFLGIDHTAIAVSNTGRSLAFYRDLLHLHVTGGSENYGSEQEHLSGLFNAHVLITSLRSDSGIGIELLDYLSPGSGRPISPNMRDNDIASWQTRIQVNALAPGPREEDLHWLKLPPNPDGYREAVRLKDPDGHSLELLRR